MGMDTGQPEYETNSNGVAHLQPGKYLAGINIFTAATKTTPASSTLGALTFRVSGHPRTVTADARKGVPVQMSLKVAGASQQRLTATVCAPGPHIGRYGLLDIAAASADSSTRLYVIPSRSTPARFGVSSSWTGTDGREYLLARTRAGLPAGARFAFRARDLGTLALQVASGASEGSSGIVEASSDTCAGALSPQVPLSVPGRQAFQVSPGDWSANFAPNDSNDDTTTLHQKVTAHHRVTRTFGAAVRAPSRLSLPVFDQSLRGGKDFYFSTASLFADPTILGGDECCSHGTIAVRGHGKVLKKVNFISSYGVFETALRTPGLYTVDISATRQPPHQGVSPAILSTRIHLTWKFRATASDLQSAHTLAPVSVTTLKPAGLDLRNDAKPGVTTGVRFTIWPGQNVQSDPIKSVRVQASDDGGKTWHAAPVSGKALSRLARVKDPSAGFVTLRITVTDIHGDSTVETIDRAYGIS
ncbi:MAG TPA: hypothetical protein VFI65_14200 [Streptosporangiaceae bacterium]|nr:hypothetical protein [Streptosporangiaceae bacterium]